MTLGFKVDTRFGVSEANYVKHPIWWDVVLREASDSFDFAVIHRYRKSKIKGDNNKARSDLTLSKYISDLKTHIESGKHAKIQLALTEWNIPYDRRMNISVSEHALDITELLGNYLEGRVDFMMYWPLRLQGKYSLLTFKQAVLILLDSCCCSNLVAYGSMQQHSA